MYSQTLKKFGQNAQILDNKNAAVLVSNKASVASKTRALSELIDNAAFGKNALTSELKEQLGTDELQVVLNNLNKGEREAAENGILKHLLAQATETFGGERGKILNGYALKNALSELGKKVTFTSQSARENLEILNEILQKRIGA